MYLIVGLGNPGIKYKHTRHNVGFEIVDNFLKKYEIDLNKYQSKMHSHIYDISINSERVLIIKPQTYMNLSGTAVREVMSYFKIPIDNLLVIVDDMDLEFGKIRLRDNGSSGGHNGLKDIEKHLGRNSYKRLKIGIGKSDNAVDYVLGKFTNEEIKKLEEKEEIFNNIIIDFIGINFDDLMNKYNNK